LKTGYYLNDSVLLCSRSWTLFLTSAQKRTASCLNSSMHKFQTLYVSLSLVKNAAVVTGYTHRLVLLSSVIFCQITLQVNNNMRVIYSTNTACNQYLINKDNYSVQWYFHKWK